MRTAKQYPEWAKGWIVIDGREAPSLEHAVGSQIFHSKRGAEARRSKVAVFREHLHVVPVDGKSEVFALDYIDCSTVVVSVTGKITLAPKPARQF